MASLSRALTFQILLTFIFHNKPCPLQIACLHIPFTDRPAKDAIAGDNARWMTVIMYKECQTSLPGELVEVFG